MSKDGQKEVLDWWSYGTSTDITVEGYAFFRHYDSSGVQFGVLIEKEGKHVASVHVKDDNLVRALRNLA